MERIRVVNNGVLVVGLERRHIFDGNYEEAKGYGLKGVVVGIGDIGLLRGSFCKSYRVNVMVNVGDDILIRWYGVERALDLGVVGSYEGKDVYYVEYEHIVMSGGKLVNGNVLISTEDRSGKINVGIVVDYATDVLEYIPYDDDKENGLESIGIPKISVGDKVLVRGLAAVPVDYHLEIPHYVLQDKNIIMVLDSDSDVEIGDIRKM